MFDFHSYSPEPKKQQRQSTGTSSQAMACRYARQGGRHTLLSSHEISHMSPRSSPRSQVQQVFAQYNKSGTFPVPTDCTSNTKKSAIAAAAPAAQTAAALARCRPAAQRAAARYRRGTPAALAR